MDGETSHEFLSISQMTRKLNCTILMFSSGYIVQDAQTVKTIGNSTERGGL